MSRPKRCAVGFITILITLLLGATQIHAEQLPIRTYTTADGLARDRIFKIVSDPRGYLWFCTYDGLSRFDGYEFVNYTVADGLPHRLVQDLIISRTGEYWIATYGGLARFNPFWPQSNPKFKSYVPSGRPGSEVVLDLYQDHAGTVWLGTGNGLYRLREANGDVQFEYVNLGEKPGEELDIATIVEDSPGVLWIGTETGLFRYRDNNAERFTIKNGLPHDHVRDIVRDADGTLWIGTGMGLSRLKPEIRAGDMIVSRLYTTRDGMLNNQIMAMFRSSNGTLWIATALGLAQFSPQPLPDGGHFINYTRAQGLSDSVIRAIGEDPDGNLWLGSESGGAMKVIRRGFTSYSEADGLETGRIASIGETHSGELFVITGSFADPSYHIHRFENRRLKNIRVNLPAGVVPTWGWNQLFVEDGVKQQWWVPTTSGLFRFPALRSLDDFARVRPLRFYSTREGLSQNEPFRLFEDSNGDIWISTISDSKGSHLNRWDRATDTIVSYPPEIAGRENSAPTALGQDRAGNVWIGFYYGNLARFRHGKFDTFTQEHGVPTGMIRELHVDRNGRLWIATAEGGLGRIEDPTSDRPGIVTYTTKEGLSSDQITCITEDQWGRIYIGTGLGVDRVDPDTSRVKRYTIADGLPNGFVNIAYRDRQNALWFGTLQGLSRLVPSEDPPGPPPPILIQHVRVAGADLPISELGATQIPKIEFAARQNQLEIKFVSLGFRAGDVLRYQFRLEGADDDWSAPSVERSVHYANLKPGSYRFLVRALNADGVFSKDPATFTFTIVPPFWQRWWFITLTVLALAGVTHLIYRYHARRLVELERVRTRIATDLHDDIGANLSKIAILSEVAGQQLTNLPAVTPVVQIAEISRDCVDSMSDIVWAINPQRDHLTDLTYRMRRFAEDLLDAKEIDFAIRSEMDATDVRLGSDVRREVYLIFKECVNNLVKHSDCRKAEFEFSINGLWLFVSVSDDGKGFTPSEPGSNGGSTSMGGHGLANMKRRARAVGGSLQIDSHSGRGTRITLTVPIRSRSRSLRWPFNYPNGR